LDTGDAAEDMLLSDGLKMRMMTSYGKMSGTHYLVHAPGIHTETTITFSNTFVTDAQENDDDNARSLWMSLALLLGLAAVLAS
jgi:hypothetical protein